MTVYMKKKILNMIFLSVTNGSSSNVLCFYEYNFGYEHVKDRVLEWGQSGEYLDLLASN